MIIIPAIVGGVLALGAVVGFGVVEQREFDTVDPAPVQMPAATVKVAYPLPAGPPAVEHPTPHKPIPKKIPKNTHKGGATGGPSAPPPAPAPEARQEPQEEPIQPPMPPVAHEPAPAPAPPVKAPEAKVWDWARFDWWKLLWGFALGAALIITYRAGKFIYAGFAAARIAEKGINAPVQS